MPTPPYIAELREKVGHSLLFVPTVTVIARDARGRLLLVHDRDARQWTLPGGIMEPDETPADAAVREVWEETGVHVALSRLVGVVGGPGCGGRYGNGDRLGWVATVFAARMPADCRLRADGSEVIEARLWETSHLADLRLSSFVPRFLDAEARAGDAAFFEPAAWQPPG